MSAKLFEPVTIHGVEFRNRVAMSPMCMHSAGADGRITDFHLVHYGARALGGAGLVMLETASVLPNGVIGPGDLGIWDDGQIGGLARVAEIIRKMGSKAGAQIGHAGRMLGIDHHTPVAPSALAFADGYRTPAALTEDGILEVIAAFGAAARRAKDAGFDVVEIHTAHGYLLGEFLSPLANLRTDRWGGDHANRYRIVRAVIDAVRAEWSGPLFVRISSTDYVDGRQSARGFPDLRAVDEGTGGRSDRLLVRRHGDDQGRQLPELPGAGARNCSAANSAS